MTEKALIKIGIDFSNVVNELRSCTRVLHCTCFRICEMETIKPVLLTSWWDEMN